MVVFKKYFLVLIFLALAVFGSAWASSADVIIDNGGSGTSYTGAWSLSGGTEPYGASSLWSRDGATYTYSMAGQPSGTYEVLLWWSGWYSRASSVPVAVKYTGGAANVTVDQSQNSGKWNSLGTFFFDGSGSVTITAVNGDTVSTCADAVQFRLVSSNASPIAVIDSITPSPAKVGENIAFTGHGTDTDGSVIAYEWSSSIDGILGTSASFSTAALSSGTHTISFKVKDNENAWSPAVTMQLTVGTPSTEVIIDNGEQGTSFTGTWEVSGGTGAYGTNSLWSRNGTTYTFTMTGKSAGMYEVFMWWSGYSTRPSSVPVAITYTGGTSSTTVNQKQNYGQWNSLGTFYFDGSGSVRITSANDGSTCADAVKFTLKSTNLPPVAAIDSISPNPAEEGEVVTFTGHGTDPDGSITGYEWTSSVDGIIGTAASFTTSALSPGTHTISFRVKDNQDLWSQSVKSSLVVQGGNIAPTAVIDSITPNPANSGQTVTFTGHGTDADGNITAYEWSSSIDGIIGNSATFSIAALSSGMHTISFRVKDSQNLWSPFVTAAITVGTIPATELIVDNGAAGTSYTGTWAVSGGTGSYGSPGVWSRNGATYTFTMSGRPAGTYEVSMWWSGYATRAPSVPVAIHHAGGTANVTVNQSVNASRWNSVGTFTFNGTGSVVITAAYGDTTSTCADGVKFTPTATSNEPPAATIDSIAPNPAAIGQSVTFNGHGTDQDGSITQYEWTSSLDGIIGNLASFNTSTLKEGIHIITFRVMDDDNTWSAPVSASLTVGSVQPSEAIVDNTDAATSHTGTWYSSAASGYYGTNSLWSRDGATFTWKFTPSVSGYFDVSMWWTTTSTRSPTVPVSIKYAGGSQIVTVNQLQNAGKWNSLGSYPFNGGVPYSITVTSQPYPASTCADAVKITPGSPSAPVADFNGNPVTGTDPLSVQFTDMTNGVATSWIWDFGDGSTSSERNPVHVYSEPGYYTVSMTASGPGGLDTKTRYQYIYVMAALNTEHIYIGDGYSSDGTFLNNVKIMLRNMGIDVSGDTWYYTNKSGKNFIMHVVTTPEAFMTALKTADAHIIFNGHANYGLGGVFATPDEVIAQRINTIYYIDDARITHNSTPMVGVSIAGMRQGQAYPNWNPVFSDGASGVMPHTFAEGTPPYNYYITYKVPGDPVLYRVELSDGTYLQRFPASGVPAWYSASGLAPDPAKDKAYFITNYSTSTDPYKPHYGSRTILYGNRDFDLSELKYTRMYHGSCNSCNYYAGNFNRGIMYCTTSDSDLYTAGYYLQDYLNGMSDSAILTHLNTFEDVHEIINFNLKPPSLR